MGKVTYILRNKIYRDRTNKLLKLTQTKYIANC